MAQRLFSLLAILSLVAGLVVVPLPAIAAEPSCTITGTEGPDTLVGTAGDDVVCALGGDDIVDGLGGSDIVYAGDGNDYVDGGTGDDTLFGGPGDDELRGNEDNDLVFGEDGNDILGGGKGNDELWGGTGNDFLEGKRGDDTLFGGPGDDELRGNEDNDLVFGEDGNDILGGGKGSDQLFGGSGDDILEGKDGDDALSGGVGTDNADGGNDVDSCDGEVETNCEQSLDVTASPTWSPGSVMFIVPTGSSETRQVILTVDGDIAEAELVVTGDGSDLVEILQPAALFPLDSGVVYEFQVTVSASTTTPERTHNARVQLVAGGTATEPPLDLSINVTPPTSSVSGFAAPSSDRIAPSDVGPDYIDGELLIGLKTTIVDPDITIQQLATQHGGVVVGGDSRFRSYQVRFPAAGTSALRTLRDTIALDADVELATLHYVGSILSATPNDPEWDTWNESNPSGNNWHLEYIGAPSGWDTSTGHPTVKIAVIDNEIDDEHEDLAANFGVVGGFPIEGGNGHGTRVAGVACAVGDNGVGVSGVAWECDLNGVEWGFPIISAPGQPVIYFSPAMLVTRMGVAADLGARVVNMSWGQQFGECAFSTADPALVAQEMLSWNGHLGLAIAQLEAEGLDILWVAAAGNIECDAQFISPAALSLQFDNVITVGGIEGSGEIWHTGPGGSAFGPAVDVAAPATDILSTSPHHGWWFWASNYESDTGTSFAAPQVTGLAALMLDVSPAASASELKSCIVTGAENQGTPVAGHAFNVINVQGALDCIAAPAAGPATNFNFETGDLTGWTIIDSGEGDNWYEVQSPGLLGTNFAFRIENSGAPVDGIEQTAVTSFGDCAISVTTVGEAGTTARLEVVDASDGSVWDSMEYTYTGLETEPVVLGADDGSGFLPNTYTVRLLYVQRVVELAVVVFDEIEIDSCT